jgi:hypothetical protein
VKSWQLGAVALIFFAVHAGYHVTRGNPEDSLWMCHLATVGIGVGLIGGWPALNAIGVLWLLAGLPLWAVYLATGGEFFPTSILPHLGGLVLGMVGLTRLGVPAGVWAAALAALIALVLVCRVATPERADVNLAFTIWPVHGAISLAHAGTVIAAVALLGALFLGLERGALKVGVPAPGRAV